SGNQRHGNISSFTRLYSLSNFISGIPLSGGSSRDTFSVLDCKSISSPSGKFVWTKTGIYRDTISNFTGCDSLLLIHVKIGSSSDTISVIACDSFISPLNNIHKNSGIYKETYSAYTGCDSVVFYKVSVFPNKLIKLKVSSCDSFISPSGKKYDRTGVYTEHYQTYYGCDSAIEYDVKILEQSISLEIINACDSVFIRSKWYKQNATPRFVFKNKAGCDSTHTIVIRLQYSNINTVKIIACDSFITPNKGIIRKDSMHTETYRTIHGCDSVVTYKVKVQKTIQNSLSMKACRNAIINGKTYTNSGMVNLKLKTYLGCDSLVAINLNVVKINRGIERKHGVLTSMQPDAKYTWINCINKQAIPFQTDSTFKVKLDDYYAVAIEYEGCKDTSICYHFLATSIDEATKEDLNVFPQPNQGDFTIKFKEAESGTLYIHDLSGRLISEQTFEACDEWHIHQQLSKGIYVLTIVNGDRLMKQKLIIN
ncbi:MAG TPA: T9SS type A sorting domain-containing protein, partial [Bacteroidia bacterium]